MKIKRLARRYLKLCFCLESHHLGVPPLVIQPGTVGNLLPIVDEGQRSQLITWKITYSALDVFSFETCHVLYCPGIGIG